MHLIQFNCAEQMAILNKCFPRLARYSLKSKRPHPKPVAKGKHSTRAYIYFGYDL